MANQQPQPLRITEIDQYLKQAREQRNQYLAELVTALVGKFKSLFSALFNVATCRMSASRS
ncbi:MAG: hypothetical protein R3175_15795 [Marinobacter sp.]|uniref:RSP_7527 family protein n=1 Tax=Marinobacter sp. TaxID=50741 RepID=UPI00299D39AC|nr:hypothetical protein [Marinobacter sp.]MDX1757519.1 hypothetical protein [Marinobacter sp.]